MGKHLHGFHHRITKGASRDCIYVVVDRLTKYSHLFDIPTEYISNQVADLFFREVFRIHGLPRNIINDQYSRFLVHFGRSCSGYLGQS
jgi:hypothetical protein